MVWALSTACAHPQTNGMVERFNGRISEVVSQRFRREAQPGLPGHVLSIEGLGRCVRIATDRLAC